MDKTDEKDNVIKRLIKRIKEAFSKKEEPIKKLPQARSSRESESTSIPTVESKICMTASLMIISSFSIVLLLFVSYRFDI